MRNLIRLIVQYYFILLFLLLEGIALILIFQFDPFHKSFIVNVSRSLTGNLGAKVSNIRDYLFLKDENENLSNEVTRLQQDLQDLSRTVYISLPDTTGIDTLYVSSDTRFRFLPAEIISNSVNKQYNYITLDKGKKDSVDADMAVVSSSGVVGMILNSSENFATVQPLINRNSKTGAKIRGEDYFGILEWDGRDPGIVHLKEIPLHVELEVGDTIETSGFSSVYPKGQLIGKIAKFDKKEGNFYDIEVKLFVNFRTVNHVMVVSNIYREEQIKLEGGEE
jgi:rod shape-determining protein MreC